jgi:hypothetical protein
MIISIFRDEEKALETPFEASEQIRPTFLQVSQVKLTVGV